MTYGDLFIDPKLPEPLGPSEVCKYFQRYQSGDNKARQIIIKHNIKLVIYIVLRVFGDTLYDSNELVSVGLIGLIKSVDTFDISKKVPFATYATKCIKNEILMFIRKEKKYQKNSSIDKLLSIDKDGHELTIKDILQDDNSDFVSDYEKKETNTEVRKLVESLSGRDKKIIMLYFGFDNDEQYTQQEIASKLHISQSYISRRITKILKRINIQLEQGSTNTKIKKKINTQKKLKIQN